MKKLVAIILLAAVCLCIGTSCGTGENPAASDKINIVTTIFPIYDWVRELTAGSGKTELTMLLDSGVDLHSYQPTADDMIKMSTCDVFIYVGGESDKWVSDALKESVNKDMRVVNLFDVLEDEIKEEETVEGMEAENEHGEEAEEETEFDEHIWLSLENAVTCVNAVKDVIASVDTENAQLYETNAKAYTEKLNALDAEYEKTIKEKSRDTLIFTDRFPFRYLTDDYELEYFAAFSGCSAESEASFETVKFLADKVDELDVPAVLTIEGSENKIAQTVISASGKSDVKIISVNSLQSVTETDVKNGVSYLDIMKNNLALFAEALT